MSQGLIRLKKVKVAPKRNLSIIKTSVYKKQLSVRFEDQKPIDTIKNLSQDIDQISQVIDSYFPLKPSDSYTQPAPTNQDLRIKSFHTSNLSTTTTSSLLESNQCFYCRHQMNNSLDKTTEAKSAKRDIGQNEEKMWKIEENSEKSKDELGKLMKYRNMAPAEAYGIDFRIVKKGRSYRPIVKDVDRFDKNENLDLVTPKVVKQSILIKKVQKNKRQGGKDFIIAA